MESTPRSCTFERISYTDCKNKDLLPWRWSRTFYQKKYKFELTESVNNLQLSILEAIGAKVTFGKNIVKIISIYRPPRNDRLRTIQDFERLLDSIGTDGNIILAGDTNIHLDKQSILRLNYEKHYLITDLTNC